MAATDRRSGTRAHGGAREPAVLLQRFRRGVMEQARNRWAFPVPWDATVYGVLTTGITPRLQGVSLSEAGSAGRLSNARTAEPWIPGFAGLPLRLRFTRVTVRSAG